MAKEFDEVAVLNRVLNDFIGEIWHCQQYSIEYVESDFE